MKKQEQRKITAFVITGTLILMLLSILYNWIILKSPDLVVPIALLNELVAGIIASTFIFFTSLYNKKISYLNITIMSIAIGIIAVILSNIHFNSNNFLMIAQVFIIWFVTSLISYSFSKFITGIK